MAKRIVVGAFIALLLGGLALAQPLDTEPIFTQVDPRGDSFGPGNYTYPEDPSFPQELPEMLDLVEFRVINTESATRFEFQFAQPPNSAQPWGGAGYNFHRLDLYIVSGSRGSKTTFRPGAQVLFKEPWQVNLRIRDWQGAYLLHWEDDPDDEQAGIWQGETEGIEVFVQGNAIVAEVGHDLLPPAEANWRYYVLVGLQDAYGPDYYRKVASEGGPWTGGGGSETEFSPNVYDILAGGTSEQKGQLAWEPGRLAKLEAVGKGGGGSFLRYLLIVAVVLMAAGGAAFFWLFKKR